MLLQLWHRWLVLTRLLGTVQMVIMLTVVYWVFVSVLVVPFGIIADPLSVRRRHQAGWQVRVPPRNPLEWMRRQG